MELCRLNGEIVKTFLSILDAIGAYDGEKVPFRASRCFIASP